MATKKSPFLQRCESDDKFRQNIIDLVLCAPWGANKMLDKRQYECELTERSKNKMQKAIEDRMLTIPDVLVFVRGNQTEAARLLGLNRGTLAKHVRDAENNIVLVRNKDFKVFLSGGRSTNKGR